MNTLELRRYKALLVVSARQRQILDGMLLGDAHLERQRGGHTARLKIEHSINQASYVAWKYQEWRDWVRTPPRVRQRTNRLGTSSVNVCFTTLSHQELDSFRMRFYADRRKVVPQDLVLTPLSLAVWFMDDGSRKSSQCRGLYLNTQSFSADEVDLLRHAMHRDVGIATSVRKQTDGLQIYIPSPSVAEFSAFISRHVLPSMMYKLSG